jgi:rSAM/selenodomain-associated transferase 2
MTVAVIIPVLNEATYLPRTLAAIGADVEIIIVDAGSTDDSCAIATAAGAKVIHSTPPRSQQLNMAAATTTADTLLFLHADTLLPIGWHAEVKHILAQQTVALGAFSLAIAEALWAEAFIAHAATVRSRFLHLPYGDQALFLKRETYVALGGFPDVPIMDDYMLVRAAQKHGRIITSNLAVITSNRRWRKLGVWRTTLRNLVVVAGYHLGWDLHSLQRYYRR